MDDLYRHIANNPDSPPWWVWLIAATLLFILTYLLSN